MTEENLIVSFFNKIEDSSFFRTKMGLLFVVLFLYSISNILIKPLFGLTFSKILFITTIILYIVWWFYFSGRLFFSSKIKFLFAVDFSNEAKKYREQIERIVKSQIDELHLSRSIEIISMPSDFIVSDRTKAEKYVKRRMIDLLIWGYNLEGKLQNSKVYEFRLHFTYLYRILPSSSKEIFIKQIQSSLRNRYWQILDERSFSDIQVVSNNITEISLFIIGLCLFVRGELKKSLDIFEKVKILLMNKNEVDFPSISIIKSQIDSYLLEGYRFMGMMLREIKPKESKEYFKKVFNIKPDDSGAHLNMAKISYLLDNDLKSAKWHTDQVRDIDSKPLAHYNYAFFGILEDNPIEVLSHYQSIRTVPSENIVDILSFLQNEFVKNPKNILYHFALGYINIYHGDIKIGIEELKEFVKKAKNISKYKDLVSNAEPLLKSREKENK